MPDHNEHSHHHCHLADETIRRKWQNPESILKDIGLSPGDIFMDIGCGRGFFAIPAARIVGSTGKVYGLDIDEDNILALRRRAATEGLNNVDLTVGPGESTMLCQTCADFVFMGTVLHDFQDPARVLQNARNMLKPNGKLVNVDWKKIDQDFGPPLARRFDELKASQLITSAGFKVGSVRDSGEYFYMITARL